MSTVTLRIPDEKHRRLEQLAKTRRVSVNKLLDERATVALASHDAETRFRALAARGNLARGLRMLDELAGRERARRAR